MRSFRNCWILGKLVQVHSGVNLGMGFRIVVNGQGIGFDHGDSDPSVVGNLEGRAGQASFLCGA